MRSELIRQCKRLKYRNYRPEQIALVMGLTIAEVEFALGDHRTNEQAEKKGSPDEIVDGERMAERIERMKRGIRSGEIVVERVR